MRQSHQHECNWPALGCPGPGFMTIGPISASFHCPSQQAASFPCPLCAVEVTPIHTVGGQSRFIQAFPRVSLGAFTPTTYLRRWRVPSLGAHPRDPQLLSDEGGPAAYPSVCVHVCVCELRRVSARGVIDVRPFPVSTSVFPSVPSSPSPTLLFLFLVFYYLYT